MKLPSLVSENEKDKIVGDIAALSRLSEGEKFPCAAPEQAHGIKFVEEAVVQCGAAV